jgi:hypothetical protein
VAAGVGILGLALRARDEIHSTADGVSFATVLGLIILGTLAFIWLLLFYFWIRGTIRAAIISRRFPGAVLVDILVNYPLVSDLQQANAILGVPPIFIWSSGYITVAATRESVGFYSRAFRPRKLCEIPANLISTVEIRTIDFPTRSVTRHFPAIVITLGGAAQGFTLGMLPLRTQLMVPRKLTADQLRRAADDLAVQLGTARELAS